MPREWWQTLPAPQRREYERSAGIARLPLRTDARLSEAVRQLHTSLAGDDRASTEHHAQQLVSLICKQLSVATARVHVEGTRPHDARGELHGLYQAASGTAPDRITVWMRTARRGDVVAIRTFLRTLLHEVGHHLDGRLLGLPSSFHSKGFYQRESSLFRAVTHATALAAKARRNPPPPAPATDGSLPPSLNARTSEGIDLLRAVAARICARSSRNERL
jgi:hypothetical protein